MLNPIRFCYDLFDDKNLSDENLQIFAEDHLIRLANNNPGAIYSLLITDTNTKYNAYYGKMSSEANQLAFKEGLTITKNNTRAAVEEKLSKLQSLVKYKFGEESDIYQEFYPHGMDEYYQAKDGALALLYDRFEDAATDHLTADHPAEVTAVTNLITAYNNAYTAQKNALSLIDNVITGKNTDRKALTVQLTKNFLIIASNNIDLPDQYDDFYDTQYLPITTSSGEAPVVEEGPIGIGQIVNIVAAFPVSEGWLTIPVKLEAIGTNLQYYFADSPSGEPGALSVFVNDGQVVNTTLAALGAAIGNGKFNVKNVGITGGQWKVTIG